MDLLLWRHAAAQEASETLLDAQCELTPRGLRQSARIAHWLNQHLPEGTVVLAPMRKAGVWWLRRRTRDGNPSTVLLCAQSPETL